ncbi:hypothetical protein AK88_03251 [Plasmodium fragile]|uniref:Leucine-rich repeat protein n=1 Tax=Plasmodium fragile TaxID=5857 RepID=A0A0D9QJG7_PLAFR|nr:uncharacterized protein AK88_03251 [Plasmodium fragile]KJP87083.1 hypothetical protein AK88_03251 [Plasmodium fragile]
MIDDNLTAAESDNNLFDEGIKFLKSEGTNSFHSVEPVVASDDECDEDVLEKDDQDEPGGPNDVEEAWEHDTCTPLGEKLKDGGHNCSLTQTTVDNSTPSDNQFSEYKNIILTLKKINESVDSTFDCNIVNLFVQEQGKLRIVCVKRCNTREGRIGQLPGKYRSVEGVEEVARGVVLPRARCVSPRRHHDWNSSLEGEQSEEAAVEAEAVAEVAAQPTRNSLRRKGEHSEGNERTQGLDRHLLGANHFISKPAKCRGSSPSCTQGFDSITCSMTSNAGGSSTAQGGMEAVEEANSEVAMDAVDQVSQHTEGAGGRGEDTTPCSEDADALDGEIFLAEKKMSDDEHGEINGSVCGSDDDGKEVNSPYGYPYGDVSSHANGHVERGNIKNSASCLRSPPYHDISGNHSVVHSSKKSAEGFHTWRGKPVNVEDGAEQSTEMKTPFCAPPNCVGKRLDGEEFPLLCYYGCGKDSVQPPWRQNQRQRLRSVQSEKTMEKRITISGSRKSVPSEYTCRRTVYTGTDMSNVGNMKMKGGVEVMHPCRVEGKDQSGNPLYHLINKNYRGGCVTNGRVLPKFKSLSNNLEEAHSDGLHFINTWMRQSNGEFGNGVLSGGVYMCESSARKDECYAGKSQGNVLNPWEDARTGQDVHPCGEAYTQEGEGRMPFFPPSARMYSRDDHLIARSECDALVPPFKGLEVNCNSSRDLSWRGSGGYGQPYRGGTSGQLPLNDQQVDAGQGEVPSNKGWSNFHAEKDIFFEAIKNIIRIMKEIKKIKINLKIERNYSLVIEDKKKKNELEKLIHYLIYQKEVRKKLKKHYFDKINKGLFTFLLRSNRANFFFTEEEVKLLKSWNEIKYTKMSSSSGENTEGEGDGGRTSLLGKSGGYVDGELSDRRKILHQLRHLNNVIGQKGSVVVEGKGEDEALWTANLGDSRGEASCGRGGKQRKNKNVKESIRSGYVATTPSCPIWYESYFIHCEKSQRNIFNIFLCLKNIKRKCISQKFKRKIKNGQIYLSKIYDGRKMLGHVKYILEELLRRNVPEIVCLHINDCFVDATISFFISLLLLLFKNVHTIKVIRCQIYYSYLSVFLSYQKRNNLKNMHFVCNSIFWTRPPDFRNLRGEVLSARQQDNLLLYFNTNYVKKRKGKRTLRGDVTETKQPCGREDERESSLEGFFEGKGSPSNGAGNGDYRIVVKRKKKVARFSVDQFYDYFVLGKEATVGGEAIRLKEETVNGDASVGGEVNVGGEARGVDNERTSLDSPANAYNIHSGSGSDENTSEDSLKEELHECLCTFPRKRIQQANFSMLKKLKLCSNKLNDDALMYICTLIKKDKLKNLKVLDLRWNNFTYRSLLALSLALTNTTVSEASDKIHYKKRKLHKLLLSGNNIKSSLYSSFLSSFCTCNFIVVKKLDFSMNVIDNDSFPITLKYFKHIFQLQKKKEKKKIKIGDDVFINLDHNNLKNSVYINKLAQLLNKFPSKRCKSNREVQTPSQETNSIGEECRQGVLLSLQYNNIKRGTLSEDPGRGSTSRIKF